MKNFAKVSIITCLIFSIISCSTNQPTKIATTVEKPIVVLVTGYTNYPRIALFNGGEVLVPLAEINAEGQVTIVSGVVFIAPDGRSITLYFENGLPVRAIAEDHLIQFENFTGSTVDITVIAPDGAISKKEQVPFDMNQISSMGSWAGVHLASMAKNPSNKDINWLPFASTALGVFSCAATVATGGALSVLLGVSCGILIYTTYFAIVEKDPPVQVENAGLIVSSTNCALGIIQKEPLAASECVNTVVDIVQIATKKSQETEQKLVTMVGANPNTRSELTIVAVVESAPVSTSASECAGLNLTPEECVNNGTHKYHTHLKTTFENNYLLQPHGGGGCAIYNKEKESTVNVVFMNETVDFYGGKIVHKRIGKNTYSVKEAGSATVSFERKVVFTLDGFSEALTITTIYSQFQFTHICEQTTTYTLIP